jgi:hypothetical protein
MKRRSFFGALAGLALAPFAAKAGWKEAEGMSVGLASGVSDLKPGECRVGPPTFQGVPIYQVRGKMVFISTPKGPSPERHYLPLRPSQRVCGRSGRGQYRTWVIADEIGRVT